MFTHVKLTVFKLSMSNSPDAPDVVRSWEHKQNQYILMCVRAHTHTRVKHWPPWEGRHRRWRSVCSGCSAGFLSCFQCSPHGRTVHTWNIHKNHHLRVESETHSLSIPHTHVHTQGIQHPLTWGKDQLRTQSAVKHSPVDTGNSLTSQWWCSRVGNGSRWCTGWSWCGEPRAGSARDNNRTACRVIKHTRVTNTQEASAVSVFVVSVPVVGLAAQVQAVRGSSSCRMELMKVVGDKGVSTGKASTSRAGHTSASGLGGSSFTLTDWISLQEAISQ